MNRKAKIKQILFVVNQISYKENMRKVIGTKWGGIWHVLSPFIYMLVLATYYQNIITHDIEMYPVFVFIGISIMNFYRTATIEAMDSLVNSRGLLQRTKLPIEVFVDVKVLSALKEFFYSIIALIPILIYFHVKISLRALEMIPIIIMTTLVIVGMGKILALIYLFFGDIDYLYRLFMTMMFFVSGVFIPLDDLPERFRFILSYNPIFLSIYLSRNCLMYNVPSYYFAWVKMIIETILLYCLGSFVFYKNRNLCVSKL